MIREDPVSSFITGCSKLGTLKKKIWKLLIKRIENLIYIRHISTMVTSFLYP